MYWWGEKEGHKSKISGFHFFSYYFHYLRSLTVICCTIISQSTYKPSYLNFSLWFFFFFKERVRLYWPGYQPTPIHRCDPTTAWHGDFCLLRFRPGPIRPSLDNLVPPASADETILMPSLVRTPDRHRTSESRTPDLKTFNALSFQVAGLQEHATTPSYIS